MKTWKIVNIETRDIVLEMVLPLTKAGYKVGCKVVSEYLLVSVLVARSLAAGATVGGYELVVE
jgi:hypothetical protein